MALLFDKWHQVNRIVKFDMYPLYTRCTVYKVCYACVNISSAREFSRGALAFIRPVIPRSRAPTAYNRINAVIRTSLQCNSLALQSSKVFTPSSLPLLLPEYHFHRVLVRDETAFRKFTFDASPRDAFCFARKLLSRKRVL